MIKTEHILEFDKIKETWKTFALTESARTEIEKTEPMMSEREVASASSSTKRWRRTTACPPTSRPRPPARRKSGS